MGLGREEMALPSIVQNGNGSLVDTGHARLHELGYKQELRRDLSVISNFAFSFAIISVLTGVTTLFNTGLKFGGPVVMVYGWFIAGAFTMFVGLSMAEICSSYPTSGGLYYWSARLAGPAWAPFASWMTGWFNIVGQWAVTTSVDFSLAQLIQVIILLSTGGKNGGGYEASKYVVICFHGGILFLHALINSLPISFLSFFGQLAAAWNILGVFVLMILIPMVATERASAKFVFTHFNTDNGDGIDSKVYIFVLGLLMSQYTLTGYDASAHMTEETKNADKNGPRGIISAIAISIIVGWGYIVGITFAVTNIPYLLSSDNDAGGYAIAEIFYQAFKSRYGSGVGGIICLGVIAIAIFFCGMGSVTSNSRMAYAFSRDGAMPFSPLWHKVNKQEIPINAVWLSAFISFCMALTSLGSLVAFQAMVSIATIGLYIAYALPIFFRVTLARKSFVPGPFNLGRYGILVGWVAVLWVVTISVLFSLPVAYPITDQTLNYTPPGSPFGRSDELRSSKYLRIDGGYENLPFRQGGGGGNSVGLQHHDVDPNALKKAFVRFVKLVNENTTQRKCYLADGKQGPLQCAACGRSSKDFPDMHGLIMHTYQSDNADLLVDHLGLHKALCVLMGWNYSKPPDNSKAYQLLSADEAEVNQDDLIMWPPVVIVHNTITGKGRDGRMEGLGNKAMDIKLRDMGFGGGKSKSLYGRDGHLGITLVKFAGDESGLKEAMRLAEVFMKENHGRKSWARLQSLTSGKDDENNPNLVKMDERTREKKRIYYGYLGTASDLDKVDFETRKKVVIESMREYRPSK